MLCIPRICDRCHLWCSSASVASVDVSHGQYPVSLRGPVNSFSSRFGLSDGMFGAGSREGLLDRLVWSMSYVDSRFSCLVVPEVLIDLRFPFVHSS